MKDALAVHLINLFQLVMETLRRGGPEFKAAVSRNPKGHLSRRFDLAVESAVISYLEKTLDIPVILLSEEGGERHIGRGLPRYRIILDPVDGSENFARDIPLAGVAVAVVPADCPLSIDNVEYALIGDIWRGEAILARKGRGATVGGTTLHTSRVTAIERALISCELNHSLVPPPLSFLFQKAAGVRCFGCATAALRMVATGAVEAHLDLRGRLTAENFLAPARLILEAGGVITDETGRALPEILDLQTGYTLVASANRKLHDTIIEFLSLTDHVHQEVDDEQRHTLGQGRHPGRW
ncbi:MAG: hypothetical protein D6723_04660 [Acidobacteria bacterium]|nr:MAG: hypothetical protein D6723_04660 [Acidobacteriota bacterium]